MFHMIPNTVPFKINSDEKSRDVSFFVEYILIDFWWHAISNLLYKTNMVRGELYVVAMLKVPEHLISTLVLF